MIAFGFHAERNTVKYHGILVMCIFEFRFQFFASGRMLYFLFWFLHFYFWFFSSTCIIIDNFCTVCWWKLPKFLAEFRLASERVGILVATLMHFLHVVNTLGGWTIGPLAPVWPRSASFSRLGVNNEYNPEILGDEPFRKLSTHGLTPRNIFGKRSWNRIRFFNSDRVAIRKCLTLCFVMS